MPRIRIFIILLALLGASTAMQAQFLRLAGKVVDAETGAPIEFASILLEENGLWAITN